jgi:hypothetical protein
VRQVQVTGSIAVLIAQTAVPGAAARDAADAIAQPWP